MQVIPCCCCHEPLLSLNKQHVMQVWFVFSGNGGQWSQMGLTLLHSHATFRASIEASAAILSELGLDLVAEFEDEDGFKDPSLSAVGLCAIQIALVDILREDHGIHPDGMLGHSAGDAADTLCQRRLRPSHCKAVCSLRIASLDG